MSSWKHPIGWITAGLAAASGLAAPPALGQCEVELLASDHKGGERFGNGVSVHGDAVVIGAYQDDPNGPNSGSAYVFRFNGLDWLQEAKLSPSDGAVDDYFGFSATMGNDVTIVGSHGSDDLGEKSGAAYVFRFDGRDWTEEAKLTASDGGYRTLFGYSVAIDDNVAVIGSRRGGGQVGAAHIFRFNGERWNEEAKLVASDGEPNDYFGGSVSIDDETVVVGASGKDGVGIYSGAAYVYRFERGRWQQVQRITPANAGERDRFGSAVSLRDDVMLVGAYGRGSLVGAAYVFRFDEGRWIEEAMLTAADAAPNDQMGEAVSIDGDIAVVGAPWKTGVRAYAGAAYVFEFEDGRWPQKTKLTQPEPSREARFGAAVSIDNNHLFAGVPNRASTFAYDMEACFCTGDETIRRPKCRGRNGRNTLKVKLTRSSPGTVFAIRLSSGQSSQGLINKTGRGKAVFKGVPPGAGKVTVAWRCAGEPVRHRPYECP